MKSGSLNTKIRKAYLDLLRNLSPDLKLDIIKQLQKSLNINRSKNISSLKGSFGAFKSKKDADDIIKELRESRTFNRQIERF